MKKILIPVDETVCQKTVDLAKDMATKYGSEIVILHVKHLFEVMSHPYADVDPELNPEVYEALMKYAEDIVVKASEYFEGTGIKVSTEVLKGNAASEICDYAEKNNCDLIMISSHGHGALERFLIGGVTSKVVHHATVPVMVVR